MHKLSSVQFVWSKFAVDMDPSSNPGPDHDAFLEGEDGWYLHLYVFCRDLPPTIYEFPNREDALAWNDDLTEIKDQLRQINQDPARTNEMYREWLDRVYAFYAFWNLHYMPGDIRIATNAVETMLGCPVTAWRFLRER